MRGSDHPSFPGQGPQPRRGTSKDASPQLRDRRGRVRRRVLRLLGVDLTQPIPLLLLASDLAGGLREPRPLGAGQLALGTRPPSSMKTAKSVQCDPRGGTL